MRRYLSLRAFHVHMCRVHGHDSYSYAMADLIPDAVLLGGKGGQQALGGVIVSSATFCA